MPTGHRPYAMLRWQRLQLVVAHHDGAVLVQITRTTTSTMIIWGRRKEESLSVSAVVEVA